MTEEFCSLYRLHFREDPEPIKPVREARAALGASQFELLEDSLRDLE